VYRGGAFYCTQDKANTTYRSYGNPDDKERSIGFRVVVAPKLS
jgi:hypothetical protein